MNEKKIQELKNSLSEIVMLISQREGPLLEDLKVLLVQAMEHVATRIQQLRQEEAPPGAPPVDLTQSMPSSNIDAFGYDDKTGKLLVRFLGKYPNRNGPVYSYEGIPRVIFDLFQKGAIPARTDGKNKWGKWWKGKVPSMGAAMYTLIKNGGYPYQKVA